MPVDSTAWRRSETRRPLSDQVIGSALFGITQDSYLFSGPNGGNIGRTQSFLLSQEKKKGTYNRLSWVGANHTRDKRVWGW